MITDPLSAVAVVVVCAVVCQWVAARTEMPSVLLLLPAGVALSSVMDPDVVFGELLFTGVGLGVAILLFEGGMSLLWSNLTTGRVPVLRLVSIGAVVTWIVGSAAAAVALDVEFGLAVLIGAVLIVSGPTVVIPLLRVVRPREPVGSVLRWEGIVIDPIGAGLAIVVLDTIVDDRSLGGAFVLALTTFGAGIAVGASVAGVIVVALKRRMIDEPLQAPVTLAAVVGAYGAADAIRPESGLVAVTLLGIALANQRHAPAFRIAEFHEKLGTTILGVLFVVLGARVELSEIGEYLPASIAIVAALVLVGRPLAVLLSTIGTDLSWRDRGFVMALAPRGVVAAAVSSLFALELEQHGVDPGPLVPVVFSVVIATIAIAGTTATYAARKFDVAKSRPRGVALVGGGDFAIELASALGRAGIPVLHIGMEDDDVETADALGQRAYCGRIDSDDFLAAIDEEGVGSLVALSTADHLNEFVTERLVSVVGTSRIFGLFDPISAEALGTASVVSRQPVLADVTAARVEELRERGASVRVTPGHHSLGSDWLTICRVTVEGSASFDPDPKRAVRGERLVQFGPIPGPTSYRQ